MKNEKLVANILDVCFELELIKNRDYLEQKKENLNTILKDVAFVEILINEIFIGSKKRNIINTEIVKEVLLGLEKIRLELECETESNDSMKDKEFKVQ